MLKLPERYMVTLLSFILLTFIIYLPSIYFPFFIFDDAGHLFRPDIANPSPMAAINLWASGKTPLVFNVWQAIASLFGVSSATPFRIVNILFHLINVFLVFKVLLTTMSIVFPKQIADENNTFSAAIIGSLFFALHPTNVESVVWISSLKTLLSTAFALASLFFYLKSSIDEQFSQKRMVISFIFLLLGTVAKPGIISLCILYPVLDMFIFRKNGKEAFSKNIVFLFFLILVWTLHTSVSKGVGQLEISSYKKAIITIKSFLFYVHHSLLPINSHFAYSDSFFNQSSNIDAFLTGYEILGAIVLIFFYQLALLKKTLSFLSLAISIFFLLLLPNLGIITFDYQQLSLYADRYLYFPLIALSLLFAILFLHATKLPVIMQTTSKFFFATYLATLLVLSTINVSQWKNSSTVLAHSHGENIKKNDYAIAYFNALVLEKNYAKAYELINKNKTIHLSEYLLGEEFLLASLNEASSYFLTSKINPYTISNESLKIEFMLLNKDFLSASKTILESNLDQSKKAALIQNLNFHLNNALAEAYMSIGDFVLLNTILKNDTSSINKKEAYRSYELALKFGGVMTDPARSNFFLKERLLTTKEMNKK